MAPKWHLVIILILLTNRTIAQNPIDVTEQTIKVGGAREEELYFGFAAGDKIIFNFSEVNGKELKEIEILEYPSNSKFSDFKTSQTLNKTLFVTKESVFIFRLKNSALSGRICKIFIQRIPESDATKNFNTNVIWITKQDTTWTTYTREVIVGYDTTYLQKTRKDLVNVERTEELILDKNQRVHSTSNENGNRSSIFFTLPENEFSVYQTKVVVAWAFWIGVGNEANEAWQKNSEAISDLAEGIATYYITPLGGLAVGAITDLLIPTIGEDVGYSLCDQANKNLFYAGLEYNGWDHGKGVAGYRKFSDFGMLQGTYFLCMYNDNYIQGIDVNVKVIAIVETKVYKDTQYTDMKVEPRKEIKLFSEPNITTRQVAVTGS